MNETPAPAPALPGRRRWLPFAVIIVIGGVMAGVFYSRFGKDLSIVETPLIGTQVPSLTLDYLEQPGTLSFQDLRGSVLVVNFWASYCVPCRYEHPVLSAVSRDYADLGVRVIGVTYEEPAEASIAFLDEFGRAPNGTYLIDPTNRAVVEFGIFGIPETYIVDRDGTIVYKFNGEISEAPLRSVLDQVLAGQTPQL